jgi:hypothetical protein
VRVVALPARPDVPRFDVGGPGDLGRRRDRQLVAALVWTRPAGLHVAPPIDSQLGVILISDCTTPVAVSDTRLGCIRVVSTAGIDQSYAAIHGAHV